MPVENEEERGKTDVSIFGLGYLFAYCLREIRLHTIIRDERLDQALLAIYAHRVHTRARTLSGPSWFKKKKTLSSN